MACEFVRVHLREPDGAGLSGRFFLALGPFDRVIVSGLHLLFGVWLGGHVGYDDIALNVALTVAGNLLGGLLLMTLTHRVQEKGSRHS